MNMRIKIEKNGQAGVYLDDVAWISQIGLRLPQHKVWKTDSDGIVGGNWSTSHGEDEHGSYELWQREFSLDGEAFLSLSLRMHESSLLINGELLRDIDALKREESFEDATLLVPTFTFPEEMSFFLSTFGLDGINDDHPGGYWPTAKIGRGPHDLPKEAFAPLVLFSDDKALVISPANLFLTSPLVRTDGGVGRGLHGAVDHLPAGTRLETLFVLGDDVTDALLHLGDILLARGGKKRPSSDSHPLTSSLGWWNAYGGYYSELMHPLNGEILEELATYFKKEGIPVRYLGLDLWYPYQEIGQAIRYIPDPSKYPNGLSGITKRTGLPYVLHLSALSKENAYGVDGADPQVYQTIAQELKSEGGIVAWHDWLRTQQHFTSALQRDPTAAERWFAGMAEAFEEEGLAVLLCMQTMGMNLAATAHPNIIAARSYTDYLFGQSQQLEKLAAQGMPGFEKERTPRQAYIFNNILLGMVLHALGMQPFHDLFITNSHHPEGFGDALATQEALLRALSGGVVGIGDQVGKVDKTIIDQLAFPDGILAKPDHPLYPLQESLGEDILVAYTESRLNDEVRWVYLAIFNISEKETPYRVNTRLLYENTHVIYDYFGKKIVSQVRGVLRPAEASYFILAPEKEGIGFLGLGDKFIAAPSSHIRGLQEAEGRVQVVLSLPLGGTYPLKVFCSGKLAAEAKGAEVLEVTSMSNLYTVWVRPTDESFSLSLAGRTMS